MKRRNAAEPPKSAEARFYMQALDSGQITPAAVERKIADVKVTLDDAKYFGKPPEVIAKIESRIGDLESVLVWDQAASIERGLSAAAAPAAPAGSSALPVKKTEPSSAASAEIVVPTKTHDGFLLDRNDRKEIGDLLRLARDGRVSKTSIEEARREVEDRIRTESDKEKLQELRERFTILDEVLHLGTFALKNNPDKKPIVSKGWDGLYALVDAKGKAVHDGQKVKRFVVIGGRAPHKPDSEGRVWVLEGGEEDRDRAREYFPSVVDLQWIHEKTWKRNLRRNSDEDFRRLERHAKAGDAKSLDALERQALSGRSPESRSAWLEALQGTYRWDLRARIVGAMARALFVTAWADAEEEAGRTHHGELMDLAPETTPEAIDAAEALSREFEEKNQTAFDVMYETAAAMEDHDVSPTPEDFGHYTAMEALGHGVSWKDDHPKHGFAVPNVDFSVTPAQYGELEPELCAGCGAELEQDIGDPDWDSGDYCAECRATDPSLAQGRDDENEDED